MADYFNSKVKMIDLQHPNTVSSSIAISERPWALALLNDGLIAVTTDGNVIYLLTVAPTLTITSRIATNSPYWGVAGHSDCNLIVSSPKYGVNRVGRIDIINRDGQVLKTLTDNSKIHQLECPLFLCAAKNCLFVSDAGSSVVHKVDINTGHLIDTLSHPSLNGLYEVKVDTAGNLLVASKEGQAVVVCSPGKKWKTLPLPNNSQGYNCPFGVCLTSSGRLVVAWASYIYQSIVTVYDL
jgi:hypothetical protein